MKHKIADILIPLLFRLWSLLSLRLNHYSGQLIGWLLYIFNSDLKRIADINISYCLPHLSPLQKQQLLKKNMLSLGQAMTEITYIWSTEPAHLFNYLRVHNRELVDSAVSQHQGVIIITPHLGCWEIAGLYVASQWPCAIFYQPPKIAALESLIRNGRSRTGARLVATDKRGLAGLLKTLRSGGVTGILPDQTPKDKNSGTFAPFFNHPALTINLIASLARKSGALLLMCYARRLAPGQGFELIFNHCRPGIDSHDAVTAATALNQSVEQMINAIPEQYLWSYKRFKQLPPDVAPGTDNIYAK